MQRLGWKAGIAFVGVAMLGMAAAAARAQTSVDPDTVPGAAAPAAPVAQPQVVDLSKVSRRAWVKNPNAEIDVVQNRRYTNAQRVELGAFAGFIGGDPFLSVKTFGGSLGYHFNSFYSFHVVGWKYSASPSSAAESFFAANQASAAVNEPKTFYGAQINGNFIYGKLSVIGKVIIYLDLFLFGGAGIHDAANGKSFAPFVGIGQRVHLDRHLGIRVDYRAMMFKETVYSTDAVTGDRTPVSRNTVQEAVTLGLSYFF